MIRVSEITTYVKCPRMCFFINKGHEPIKEITPEYLERIIFKELAFMYDSAIDREDKRSFLNHELNRIAGEVRIIHKAELAGITDDALANSVSAVRSCLENICSNLSLNNFYIHESVEIEPLLLSEKFGITGSPDRLIELDGTIVPSIIKTGAMPENGIWKSDRLQLTAYAMLIEEKHDSVVELGFVEYVRWGKVREAIIKRHERRKVLQIRDKIKKIQTGVMPEKPRVAPCDHCTFKEMCDVNPRWRLGFFKLYRG